MSEIKKTWMALNTLKCNHMTPLHFKGLNLWQRALDAASSLA